MTYLTLGCRNMLVQTPEVQALIASGVLGGGPTFTTWKDGWIFADTPYANIEKRSHMALIVISDGGTWQPPNAHNTAQFPRLLVDVWASPTRKTDGSPAKPDADRLIEDIMAALRPHLHTISMAVPGNSDLDPTVSYLGRPGFPRIWGTAAEVAAKTGVLVISSESLGQPDFNDVRDGNGARMGRYAFGVHTA